MSSWARAVSRTSTVLHAKINQIKIGIFRSAFFPNRFFFLSDSSSNAPLEDTRRGETFVEDSGDAAARGGDDDATAAALLPPVSSEDAANSTQESGAGSKQSHQLTTP